MIANLHFWALGADHNANTVSVKSIILLSIMIYSKNKSLTVLQLGMAASKNIVNMIPEYD